MCQTADCQKMPKPWLCRLEPPTAVSSARHVLRCATVLASNGRSGSARSRSGEANVLHFQLRSAVEVHGHVFIVTLHLNIQEKCPGINYLLPVEICRRSSIVYCLLYLVDTV